MSVDTFLRAAGLPQSPQHLLMPPAPCVLLYPEHHLLKVLSEHSPTRYLRVTVLCIQEALVGVLYSQIEGGAGLGPCSLL